MDNFATPTTEFFEVTEDLMDLELNLPQVCLYNNTAQDYTLSGISARQQDGVRKVLYNTGGKAIPLLGENISSIPENRFKGAALLNSHSQLTIIYRDQRWEILN